jgi:hypothetical protein
MRTQFFLSWDKKWIDLTNILHLVPRLRMRGAYLRFPNSIHALVRFQVLKAASMNMTVFWNVAPCSLIELDRLFRSVYCLRHSPLHGGSKHLWNVRSVSTRLHGATCQKTAILVLGNLYALYVEFRSILYRNLNHFFWCSFICIVTIMLLRIIL